MAFRDLSSCRPVDGFSGTIGRIPWTAVNEYAKRYPFFNKDFETFSAYVSVLDEKLLELVKDNKPKKNPRSKAAKNEGMATS